ncbi:MAG: 2-octaprenyl-6-methoxyphenol hydroxylase [Lentisphaeria bacterium]
MYSHSGQTLNKYYDIVVVGGGMVGLSMLHMVAKAMPTRSICLIEAYALDSFNSDEAHGSAGTYQPSFDDRSTAVSSNSAEIFDELGLWSTIKHHVTPINKVSVTDRGHIGSAHYSQSDNGNKALGFVVENKWLGSQLIGNLPSSDSICLLAPARVDSVRPSKLGATLSINCNDEVHHVSASLVVLADGANSPLREKLGIAMEAHDYQQAAVIANVEYSEGHQCVAHERFTENGPLALLPLGEQPSVRISALVWTTPMAKVNEVLEWSDTEFLAQLQGAFGYRLGIFKRVGVRNHYPLKLMLAKEQVRSGIVLMGNAAHFLHPVAGQGFNLALRDCAQLVAVLVQAHNAGAALGDIHWLQHYVELQENDQWLTTSISHNFNRVFSSRRPALQLVRNLGLLSLDVMAPARQLFFDQMMGKGGRKVRMQRAK